MNQRTFIAILLPILLLSQSIGYSQTEKIKKHYNISKQSLAIEGYDPVAYFTNNEAIKGLKENMVSYQGINTLIDIIQPHQLYLGLKDYQQCKVIEKMIHLTSYDKRVDLKFCETIRNENGLALSSRNKRLSMNGLNKATALIKILTQAKERILASENDIDLTLISQESTQNILENGFDSVDYFAFVNENFELIQTKSNNNQPLTILTAATIEGVRLIDNIKI
jgi:pantoate--beta-alanine ligase